MIALKIAYLGKEYYGFEHNNGGTPPLRTIEGELWKALKKGCLIAPPPLPDLEPGDVNWQDCDYSKCGRTDKGVSAFGQVIGVRVRSNRPRPRSREPQSPTCAADLGDDLAGETTEKKVAEDSQSVEITLTDEERAEESSFDPIADEICYPQVLNRLLPLDIRVLAWCPSPPTDFNARFSCRGRKYKYFFTNPAFLPVPGDVACGQLQGRLDIDAMREAAKKFEGEHDFRNFCKIDPSKQLTEFNRNVINAEIEEYDDLPGALDFLDSPRYQTTPDSQSSATRLEKSKVYSFNLHGSAFLWHQVRHMVAILFLVGQGLEKPSIVSDLLDIAKTPCRPRYEMAQDKPLVLWDCIFPRAGDAEQKDALEWQYINQPWGPGTGKSSGSVLMEDIWRHWREHKMDEILSSSLLGIIARQGQPDAPGASQSHHDGQRIFDGGNGTRGRYQYVPVLQKARLESVDVVNRRWLDKRSVTHPEKLARIFASRQTGREAGYDKGA